MWFFSLLFIFLLLFSCFGFAPQSQSLYYDHAADFWLFSVQEAFPSVKEPKVHRPVIGTPLILRCNPPLSYPKGFIYWGENKEGSKLKPIDNSDPDISRLWRWGLEHIWRSGVEICWGLESRAFYLSSLAFREVLEKTQWTHCSHLNVNVFFILLQFKTWKKLVHKNYISFTNYFYFIMHTMRIIIHTSISPSCMHELFDFSGRVIDSTILFLHNLHSTYNAHSLQTKPLISAHHIRSSSSFILKTLISSTLS